MVSKDGPTGAAVRQDAAVTASNVPKAIPYVLVALNPASLGAANRGTLSATPRFTSMARGTGPDVSIGVGDILSVTIFEAESGGLFIPKEAGSRSGNFVEIPNQQVDRSGVITIPYVDGPVHVAGRTTRSISAEISSRLKSRAIEPQVVVSVVEHRGNDISVLGEVNQAQHFSMDPGGIKLLDAIARAGGPRNPPYETTVTIQRNGVTRRASMSTIIRDPSQNVALRPGDVIYLTRDQKVFMVLGATPSPGSIGGTNNRRFSFDDDTMSLSEAIAKAGGLDTTRADPKEVFLFRVERRSTLMAAGVDVSQYKGDLVPTVYTVDLRKGDNFFMANSFNIRDKDLIFVSESPSTDLIKFLNILSPITSNAYSISESAAVSHNTY
ncbi:sugar ABC transporter substrate-binding protein [Labrys miyagiensis]|uniref:Sugar ABC transporter substrate-binding protein n=1 Tax=Labrys miyagiensis TaxID=346912 RepID=A0ABQ6CI94_9HYPH|nr:polysaccharide biosynthesis/export family protein [Labrys miyagiensis]GLS19929.1 sugar ABC transporter substrate-binding protein [Labrys miyagiensis]